MIKKIHILIVATAVVAVGVALNFKQSLNNKGLSDLTIANIEALAQETDNGGSGGSGSNGTYRECQKTFYEKEIYMHVGGGVDRYCIESGICYTPLGVGNVRCENRCKADYLSCSNVTCTGSCNYWYLR